MLLGMNTGWTSDTVVTLAQIPSSLAHTNADICESQLPVAFCGMGVTSVVGEGRPHKHAALGVTFWGHSRLICLVFSAMLKTFLVENQGPGLAASHQLIFATSSTYAMIVQYSSVSSGWMHTFLPPHSRNGPT